MIYFDNAATTMRKPDAVAEAITSALTSFGGMGRGVHEASLCAAATVYEARERVAHLLGAPSAARVAFSYNVTAALNMAIAGLLPQGGVAVTTAASHNSVLRPLFRSRDTRGCTVRVAPILSNGALDERVYASLLEGAQLVVATHASNLTGDVYDIAHMAKLAHDAGALFVLDVAQTAGCYPVAMQDLGADVVCFTGHKGLYGPQGTGGLCVAEDVVIPPLLEGGSGVQSFEERQPLFMPESLEAGTVNAHGLAGLAAGIDFIEHENVSCVAAYLLKLVRRFEAGIADLSKVRVLGGAAEHRTGIVAITMGQIDSALVADHLAMDYDISTRAGAHCAPLMHQALGTERQGAVRFSFSTFNTIDEIDRGVAAVRQLAERFPNV